MVTCPWGSTSSPSISGHGRCEAEKHPPDSRSKELEERKIWHVLATITSFGRLRRLVTWKVQEISIAMIMCVSFPLYWKTVEYLKIVSILPLNFALCIVKVYCFLGMNGFFKVLQ
ncbi:hypothetical protein BS78_05G138000 [Paspalum vaginatum]|nr:hypothetical protein BS78_05G138000 [Paspalum vaginatum]KAJ1275473.1 hypothetical protein BS78_05G138000 [Paspalum vaginatum]